MNYSKMRIAELKAIAEEKGLRNVDGMKKAELASLLENVDKMHGANKEEAKQEESAPAKAKASAKKASEKKAPEKKAPEKSVEKKVSTKKTTDKKDSETESSDKKATVKKENAKKAPAKKAPAKAKKAPAEAAKDEKENVSTEALDEIPVEIEEEEASPQETPAQNEMAEGLLEVLAEGYGFIRSDNYMSGDKDIYVSPSQIRKFRLRTGDVIRGPIRKKQNPNEKFSALLYIESVNGISPSEIINRMRFEDMTPIFPDERIKLDCPGAPLSLRIVDLFSPIGKGQRGMIVSPPKAGKTTLLKQIAKRISQSNPEMYLMVLLIDERPEEVTDIKESIESDNAVVIYSTFDELPEHHKKVSEMVIERAKRLVESGKDVMILIDSITRLARAYNLTVTASGRTLSGGLDPAALHMPKKFFGAARNMREGGSLTILATALIDTGSRMDDVVFEEFKGTGNMELVLDRTLQEKRVFPAIDISKSGTRKDDLLLSAEEKEVLDIIHRRFHTLKPEEVTEDILKLFSKTRDNEQFVGVAKKLFQK